MVGGRRSGLSVLMSSVPEARGVNQHSAEGAKNNSVIFTACGLPRGVGWKACVRVCV